MKGENGLKLSSRDGTPYPLSKLIEDSIIEAKRMLKEHSPNRNVEEEEEIISKSVALSSIKYFDLIHPKDYKFSFSEMLNYKGKTGVYLLYAITRINSLLKKSTSIKKDILSSNVSLSTPEERFLALNVLKFSDVILDIQNTLSPLQLCEYLLNLAISFHAFYDKVPILNTPHELERLKLSIAVEIVLTKGCNLLGIETLEKM